MSIERDQARYILFLIDSKMKEHDGKIFCSYDDAKRYAVECIEEGYCNKFVVGMFVMNPHEEVSYISMVETMGFKGDKRRAEQLFLFDQRAKKIF